MIRAAVALAIVLIASSCSNEGHDPPSPSIRATPEEQAAIRLAYSEVQTMIFCAGPPAERAGHAAAVEARLREVRLLARQRGVGALVSRTQQQWLDSMATADIACPRDAEARIAAEIAELEALIRELPVALPDE